MKQSSENQYADSSAINNDQVDLHCSASGEKNEVVNLTLTSVNFNKVNRSELHINMRQVTEYNSK
jgi:hypothetical protein